MVLAAVYLIRLAIDSGMLTPGRQVALAVMGAFVLIGLGLHKLWGQACTITCSQ